MAKVFHILAASLMLVSSTGTIQAQNSESAARFLNQPMPEQWAFTQEVSQTLPSDDQWWKTFGDPMLDSLISIGVENNYNIREAARRRDMARLSMQQAKAGYYPSIGVSAGYSRTEAAHAGSDQFSLGADVNWEVDLFGKITSKVKSGKASYNISKADYVATMVSMTAEIVKYYINYRVLQTQIAVANEHIQYQDTVVRITQARYEAGLVSKLDVAQAKTVYYSTEATLPQLEAQAAQALNALGVLLAIYPADLAPLLQKPSQLPPYTQIVSAGVPANLLRRRPDIMAAEATLAQYAAQIGIAQKDFLPTLSIKGTVGWNGDKINRTITSDAFSYSIAPQLSWTLFDGFARKYAVASAKEQMMLGIDAYNLTVMTAFIEVENAMQAYKSAVNSLELDRQVFEHSHEAFMLSMDQYKQGLSPFTNVVNAQIDWLNYANALVSAHGDALVALIDLYKALGGSPIE